ncbi:hypothetical protein B0T26DRAFT_597642, partial [Lasiosphaeria miniovina]
RRLGRVNRHNVATLRGAPAAEISGALGDLGTLLPLMITLALQGSIDLPSTLVFSGVFNIVTGAVFGIPLPVQPMKAIAAAAIASGASLRDTVAAGAWVGAAVLFLSVSGLLRLLTAYIPAPIVKGIQVGAGFSLAISAGSSLVAPLPWLSWSAASPLDSRLCALVVFAVLVLTQRMYRRFPFALAVFILGLLGAMVSIMLLQRRSDSEYEELPHFSPWNPRLVVPAWGHRDAIGMALAQLPLTTLNSIIAAAALAADLLTAGHADSVPPPSTTALGLSVGAMNLVGCWFGAMPVCHGAGGLAAQHRFGARSGASVVLLGAFKAIVGLVWGDSLRGLLHRFPRSLLGVMVAVAGLELARVGAASLDDAAGSVDGVEIAMARREERWTVMLVTAAGILAFKNDGVGFVLGMLCHGAYRLAD